MIKLLALDLDERFSIRAAKFPKKISKQFSLPKPAAFW
jgi:hypothetical protein